MYTNDTFKIFMLLSTYTLIAGAMERPLVQLNKKFGLDNEKLVLVNGSNGNHSLVKERDDSKQAALRQLLAESIIYKCILSLPEFREKLDSSKCAELKKWLTTQSGFQSLLEVVHAEYATHPIKIVCVVIIGLFLEELRTCVKAYLDNNPEEKAKIEQKYFHHLLANADSAEDLDYYHCIGLSLCSCDEYGRTWLMSAVKRNSAELVAALVEKKEKYSVNVYAADNEGKNALCYSLMENNINAEIVVILWQAGVTLPEEYALLLRKLAYSNPDLLARILKIKEYDQWKKKCYQAVTNSCIIGLKDLLSSEEAKEFLTRSDFNPLHWAIEKNSLDANAGIAHNTSMISFLLTRLPEQRDSTDSSGRTPLHLAAQLGDIVTVKLLLEQGAEVSKQNRYGRTPFDCAKQEEEQLDKGGVVYSSWDKEPRWKQLKAHQAKLVTQREIMKILQERAA